MRHLIGKYPFSAAQSAMGADAGVDVEQRIVEEARALKARLPLGWTIDPEWDEATFTLKLVGRPPR